MDRCLLYNHRDRACPNTIEIRRMALRRDWACPCPKARGRRVVTRSMHVWHRFADRGKPSPYGKCLSFSPYLNGIGACPYPDTVPMIIDGEMQSGLKLSREFSPMPICQLLISMSNAQHRRFLKWFAHSLQTDRQVLCIKTTGK